MSSNRASHYIAMSSHYSYEKRFHKSSFHCVRVQNFYNDLRNDNIYLTHTRGGEVCRDTWKSKYSHSFSKIDKFNDLDNVTVIRRCCSLLRIREINLAKSYSCWLTKGRRRSYKKGTGSRYCSLQYCFLREKTAAAAVLKSNNSRAHYDVQSSSDQCVKGTAAVVQFKLHCSFPWG